MLKGAKGRYPVPVGRKDKLYSIRQPGLGMGR